MVLCLSCYILVVEPFYDMRDLDKDGAPDNSVAILFMQPTRTGQNVTDWTTRHVQIQFKGASSDTIAIQLAGTGHYDGTAGKITNNATNTTATSGDLELTALGTSGSVIIELRKDESFTA